MDELFSYNTLVHAVAGATGGVVGLTTLFPLDTVRTRLQVFDHHAKKRKVSLIILKEIYQQEGIAGLYRGWFPVVSSLCCSNFVYFYIYQGLKAYTGTKNGEAAAAWKDLLMAFTAGVVNVLATSPLWVVNTRLKLQGLQPHTNGPQKHYAGIKDCLLRVAREEGIAALWAGTGPSVMLAANPALQFMVYDALKRNALVTYEAEELSGAAYFFMGAFAKLIATVLTYPLQLLQTKLRAGQGKKEGERIRVRRFLASIVRTRGVTGLFQGLEAKLLQTILMAALMFLTYEKITAFVFHLMRLPKS